MTLPRWLLSTIKFIKVKRLYFVVPIAGLTISNYYKDIKGSKQQNIIDVQSEVITNMITKQISTAGTLENIDAPIWFKELDGDLYRVIYINPAYEMMMPKGMSRFELFGRTGHVLDHEFGEIWQRNDKKAANSKSNIIVLEPYRDRETNTLNIGRFIKGRVWSIKDKVVIYGIFIEKVE